MSENVVLIVLNLFLLFCIFVLAWRIWIEDCVDIGTCNSQNFERSTHARLCNLEIQVGIPQIPTPGVQQLDMAKDEKIKTLHHRLCLLEDNEEQDAQTIAER